VFRLAGGVWAFYIRAKARLLDSSFLFYVTAVQWITAECPKPMRRIDYNRSDPSMVSSMAPEVLCLYCVKAFFFEVFASISELLAVEYRFGMFYEGGEGDPRIP